MVDIVSTDPTQGVATGPRRKSLLNYVADEVNSFLHRTLTGVSGGEQVFYIQCPGCGSDVLVGRPYGRSC